MDWGQIDGVLAVAVTAIAILSGHAPTMKFAFLMLLVWATNNCAVAALGFDRATMVMPQLNWAIAVMVGYVAVRAKSWVGAVIFSLFVLSGAFWLNGYLHHTQGARLTYDETGATFLLRVLLIGGAGVKEGLAHWPAWRGPGVGHPALSRSPHVE